jgi:hypothetical protein
MASSIARFTWFTMNVQVLPGGRSCQCVKRGKVVANFAEDIWSVAEIHIAIIVVCLPTLKPLLQLRGSPEKTEEIKGSSFVSNTSLIVRGQSRQEKNEGKSSSVEQEGVI